GGSKSLSDGVGHGPDSRTPLPARRGAHPGANADRGGVGLGAHADCLARALIGLVSSWAPTPTAWFAIGFAIDDSLAQDLRRLTRLHVSFLSRPEGERWRLQASTLSDRDSSALLADR